MEMLLTIEQAALRLQLHRDTVRKQLKRGELRGMKRGRVWRVPESALTESVAAPTATGDVADAELIWREMNSGDAKSHNAAIVKMAAAPSDVRAEIARRSAQAAAAYYSTPAGEAELTDWRATSAPIHDDEGDYYTAEEEAEFRQQKAQGAIQR